MPADDHPFDALARQFEREQLTVSPVSAALCRIASAVALPWPLDKAVEILKEHTSADSFQKMTLMLETCMNQVRRLASMHDGPQLPKNLRFGRRFQRTFFWMPPARLRARGPKSG
jgi:hypothetical protein